MLPSSVVHLVMLRLFLTRISRVVLTQPCLTIQHLPLSKDSPTRQTEKPAPSVRPYPDTPTKEIDNALEAMYPLAGSRLEV